MPFYQPCLAGFPSWKVEMSGVISVTTLSERICFIKQIDGLERRSKGDTRMMRLHACVSALKTRGVVFHWSTSSCLILYKCEPKTYFLCFSLNVDKRVSLVVNLNAGSM